MPFLWNIISHITVKLLTRFKSPSPKHRNHTVLGYFIERASLPAFLGKKLSAGMTVEASIVLPLFLFFFVNLGSAMEMIRLHGNLQLALWDVGNRMCVYGYALNDQDRIADSAGEESTASGTGGADGASGAGEDWRQELGDIVWSYTYVKSQVVNYAGERYLESSPLNGGVGGLAFWESDVQKDVQGDAQGDGLEGASGDILDLIMTYQVSPWLQIPFVRPFRMSNRYYGRYWTGYELQADAGEPGSAEDGSDVVYVAENASVYHERRDCTHLQLRIRKVTLDEVGDIRNGSGARYQLCSKCKNHGLRGFVYIAYEGNAYHYDGQCSGLKRTVYTIPRQQASQYRPCSRCALVP